MAIKVNAQEFAEKWARRTAAATGDYTEGIRRVTEAPGMKAAAREEAYVQGVQRNQQKWARNVAAVPLGTWQADAINKGAPRIAAGVQQAENKVQTFASALINYEENLQNQLNNSNPRGDLEQNIIRATEWIRGMSKFQKPVGT